MGFLDPPTESIHLIRNTINVIAVIHNILILLYHSCHFQCICDSKLQYVSLYVMSLIASSSIYNTFTAWIILTTITCKWIYLIGLILWVIAKVSMYFLFLERLFVVFDDTICKFKTSQIIPSRILLILYATIVIVLVLLFSDTKLDPVTNTCLSNLPIWIFGFYAIGDFVICTVISILFSRRLLLLNMALNFDDKTFNISREDCTWDILLKSSILTFIALFTTQISLILMIVIGVSTMWVSIDSIINIWCIMLMFSVHTSLYSKICSKAESCISYKCLLCYSYHCCYPIKREIKLETNVSNHSNTSVTFSPV
eukprot:435124_1